MFKVGQKLVYVDNGKDWELGTGISPKIGEIVTIHSFCEVYAGYLNIVGYIYDKRGYPQSFGDTNFRPLLGALAKSELINSFKEVTETSDCPINVPEKETV